MITSLPTTEAVNSRFVISAEGGYPPLRFCPRISKIATVVTSPIFKKAAYALLMKIAPLLVNRVELAYGMKQKGKAMMTA
jgi:hypothetical protein